MTRKRDRSRALCATVEINGGLYSVTSRDGGHTWKGSLHGVEETGKPWSMTFELPRLAVKALEVRNGGANVAPF